MKEKARVLGLFLCRVGFSITIVLMCIFGMHTVGVNENSFISTWVVSLIVFPIVPFLIPIEFHLDYHKYAQKRYEELLAIKSYCVNPAQHNWTNRLLMYLNGCASKGSKVSPAEMEAYIKACLESGKQDDFGANSYIYDDYDPNDAVEFLKVIEPFAYQEV